MDAAPGRRPTAFTFAARLLRVHAPHNSKPAQAEQAFGFGPSVGEHLISAVLQVITRFGRYEVALPFALTAFQEEQTMCRTTQSNGSPTPIRSKTLPEYLVFLLVLISASTLAAQVSAASDVPDAVTQNQRLGRGVNIIGYDPLWKSPAKERFQDRQFELIKQAGFSHVRINLLEK